MKKILFGITSLSIGGAERILVDLCNELCKKYEITIFTIYAKGELEKELNSKIQLKTLYNYTYNEMSKIKKIFLPIKLFLKSKVVYNKKIKLDYDVEIAFLEGPITSLLRHENKNTKKIAWIHNDISKVFGIGIKAEIKKIVNKGIYQKYSKLVFVSQDNLEKFENTYNMLIEKKVIYNYINSEKVTEKSNSEIENFRNGQLLNFVSVCRLVEQKAIERLIEVHSKLIKNGYKHNIFIVGDGPLYGRLQQKIYALNVEETFKLLGKKENPYPYIRQADVFCLYSHYEGYPMVVEEAKILNKFISVTDSAVRETLRNYNSKLIVVNSEEGIYSGILDIIQNKEKYIYYSSEYQYSNGEIIEEIEEIL